MSTTLAAGMNDRINETLAPISDKIVEIVFFSVDVGGVAIPLIVFWLVLAATFFTVYLGFINIRGPKHSIDLVRGKYSDPEDAGEVSHFQALATALSGTVGLGNIAGVAVAMTLGGPGATFWMILAGILSMSTKFAECTLGVKYRNEHADGTVSGGPMYYLERGVPAVTGMAWLGKTLAVMFAIFCIGGSLGGGNMFQSNQAAVQIVDVTGGSDGPLDGLNWLVGIGFALAVGLVIIGGIKTIARVTEKIVPFMAVFYVTSCLIVLGANVTAIPGAFGDIFSGAFSPDGITGGVVGVLIVGFQRAAFSNEAGVGSASIAHSAVKTKEPVTEGYVALLEPFIDTVVICTMTALTIVITGVYQGGEAEEGVALTSDAFETVLPWFPAALSIAVALFAFSTMISWSYYGMKATGYLFNDSTTAESVFKVVFVIFTVIGAAMQLDSVIGISDAMIFCMAIPNVIGLYILARTLKREVRTYQGKISSGEFAPAADRDHT